MPKRSGVSILVPVFLTACSGAESVERPHASDEAGKLINGPSPDDVQLDGGPLLDGAPLDVASDTHPAVSDATCQGISSCDGDASSAHDCGPLTNCQQECVDSTTDPLHCGNCETTCGLDEICETGHCVHDCAPLTRCNDECIDFAKDVRHCGRCNQACVAPSGRGAVTCQAGKCDVTCDDGEPPCGNSCCDSPLPNQIVVCDAQFTCKSQCRGPTLKCSEQVRTCGSWNFESGTTEGVTVDSVGSAWNGVTFESTTAYHAEGRRSLAVGLDTSRGAALVPIHLTLCTGDVDAFDPAGYLGFHARVRVEPAPGYPAFLLYEAQVEAVFVRAPNTEAGFADSVPLEPSGWTTITFRFDKTVYRNKFSEIALRVNTYFGAEWKGTAYFDDLRVD